MFFVFLIGLTHGPKRYIIFNSIFWTYLVYFKKSKIQDGRFDLIFNHESD